MLLERRSAQLAQACRVPLAALDLGFHNWERGQRYAAGWGPDFGPEAEILEGVRGALRL